MKKIEAKIIADSINQQGDRITTYLLTFPRFILAEAKTHRIISGLHGEVEVLEDISINSFREGSKNSASSRAIPFEKMVKMVEEDPFIPVVWQRDHKGMQGTEYLNEEEVERAKLQWIQASRNAINSARMLNNNYFGVKKNLVTKQLCNRLLEPFMWHTVLVTATEWDNFFELRCPKYQWQDGKVFNSWKDLVADAFNNGANRDWVDGLENCPLIERLNHSKSQAEIHIQALAEAMWDAMNESKPKELKAGEWHIPFGDRLDEGKLTIQVLDEYRNTLKGAKELLTEAALKVATARCARLSYMTFDGEIDYQKDIELHDRLLQSGHYSPFEHCARAMSEEEYCTFIKGKSNANWDTDLVTDNTYEISAQFDNNVLGWCNNFKGFTQYRYLIENKIKI